MNEILFVVEEAPGGELTTRALRKSIIAEADDVGSLRHQMCDAVRYHFEEGSISQKITLC